MKNQIIESEVRNMEKILRWQLPPQYKKIGLLVAAGTFTGLITLKVVAPETALLSQVLKNLLLTSLLVISVSKEKDEDEMLIQLRARSYQLAFVCGVAYALIQPLVNLGVDAIISAGNSAYSDLNIIQMLFFMLAVQLALFHLMKRLD